MILREGKNRRAGLQPRVRLRVHVLSELMNGVLGLGLQGRVNLEEADPLGNVQNSSSHQLSGQPIQTLVEAHPTAGVTALDVPAPPTAQLVQAQQLRHLLHRHDSRNVLQNKRST